MKHFTILLILTAYIFCQEQETDTENTPYLSLVFNEILQEPKILQNRIRKAMERYFRNPEFLRVEFFPTPKTELVRGYFERIDIQMKNTTIRILNVTEATVSLQGLRIDLRELYEDGTIELLNAKDTKFRFLISEESVNKAIIEKKIPISNPYMKFNNGHLVFRGKWHTLFLKSEVETKGRLEIIDGNKIAFYSDRVKLNSIPIPKFIRNTIVRKINPIIDLETMSLISRVDEIILREGFMEIIKE